MPTAAEAQLVQQLTRLMNQITRANDELEHINTIDMPAVFEVEQDINRRIRQLHDDIPNRRIPPDQIRERSNALRQMITNLTRTSDELFSRREHLANEIRNMVDRYTNLYRQLPTNNAFKIGS